MDRNPVFIHRSIWKKLPDDMYVDVMSPTSLSSVEICNQPLKRMFTPLQRNYLKRCFIKANFISDDINYFLQKLQDFQIFWTNIDHAVKVDTSNKDVIVIDSLYDNDIYIVVWGEHNIEKPLFDWICYENNDYDVESNCDDIALESFGEFTKVISFHHNSH